VIKEAIEEKFREDQIKIRSILLRPAGMVIFAVIHVEIEGNKRLADGNCCHYKLRWRFALEFHP